MKWAWRQQIKSTPKLVLLALADCASDDDLICWPSLKNLEVKCSLKRNTVVRSIAALETGGFLKRTRRDKRRSNLYRLSVSKQFAIVTSSREEPVPEKRIGGSLKGLALVPESDTESSIEPSRTIKPVSLFETWQKNHGSLPGCRAFTKERQKKCTSRIRGNPNEAFLDDFRDAVIRASTTPFCRGDNDRGWKASFDWFIDNDTNYQKVLEERYGPAGNGSRRPEFTI